MEADHFVPGFELRVEDAHGGGEPLLPSSSVPHHDENVAILHDDDDDDSLIRELQWQKGPVSLPLREIEGFPEPSVFSAMPAGVHLFMEEDEIAKWLHHQFSPAEANAGRAADFGTELPGSSSIDSDDAVSLWMMEDAGDELGIGLKRTLEEMEQKAVASEGAECQSKNEEFQCGEELIDGHQPASRRTRAANVHNLSERRRRDRINEKIKALRDLMPSCYKSDQASILDDAIEYLKSLQLQVQMLSIQYNTRQMMFSNTQSYLPAMGLMGMGIGMTAWAEISAGALQHPFMPLAYPPIPPIVGTSPAHLKLPLMPSLHSANFAIAHQLRAQASNQQDPGLTSVNMLRPNMMQISDFADPYQYYAGLTPLQVPSQIQARTEPGNSKEIEQ